MLSQSHHSPTKPPFLLGLAGTGAKATAAGWSQLGKAHINVTGYINHRERQAESSDAVGLLPGHGAEGVRSKGRK